MALCKGHFHLLGRPFPLCRSSLSVVSFGVVRGLHRHDIFPELVFTSHVLLLVLCDGCLLTYTYVVATQLHGGALLVSPGHPSFARNDLC
jgi:hypothetical protein